MSLDRLVGLARANREEALEALDIIECERSLVSFMRRAWHVLEPGVDFVSGWAVECMAEHLEAVTRGELRRLVINVPPGCTKSMLVNVFWPAWEWGPRGLAHYRYISASYEQGLATRDMGRMRELVLSDWYQSKWPITFKHDMNEKTLYGNTASGWRKSSSVGASLVGYRGDRVLIDDPHDVQKVESDLRRDEVLRWGSNTVPTRLNDLAESAILVIMQRVHHLDLSAQYLAELLPDGEHTWEHLCLPMEFEGPTRTYTPVRRRGREPEWVRRVDKEGEPLPQYVPAAEGEEGARLLTCQDRREVEGELLWPERFPKNAVEELKTTFRSWGGTYAEAGQLQQRPAPREGGMFKRADFRFVDAADVPKGGRTVRGWDLANSTRKRSPYTAGVKVRHVGGATYILDVVRLRAEAKEVYDTLRATAEQDGGNVEQSLPQDPGQAGKDQKRHLAAQLVGYDVHFSPETGSKEERAKPFAAQVAAGNVYLVRGSWDDTYVAEATLFPRGEFMDQIDATSRAFMRALLSQPTGVGMPPTMI